MDQRDAQPHAQQASPARRLPSAIGDSPTLGDFQQKSGRANNFTLIRLIAACAVIYGHSYALSPLPGHEEIAARLFKPYNIYSGSVALHAFFLISGFLVTASYVCRQSIVQFLKARFLRIYPGIAVCALLSVFVLGPLATNLPLSQYFAHGQTSEFLKHNLTLINNVRFALPGVFVNNPVAGAANGPIWSLPLEVKLYLCLGLIGVLGGLRKKSVANLIIAGLLATAVLKPTKFEFLIPGPLAPACGMMFLLGAFLYLNRDSVPLNRGLLGFFFFMAVLLHGTPRFGVAFGAFIAYAALWLAYVPKLPWSDRLGDYSYGIYIYGWPVQQVIKSILPAASPLTNTALALPATFVIAIASWHFVEKPALSLKSVRLVDLLKRLPGQRFWADLCSAGQDIWDKARYRTIAHLEKQYRMYKARTDAANGDQNSRPLSKSPHFHTRESVVATDGDVANGLPLE